MSNSLDLAIQPDNTMPDLPPPSAGQEKAEPYLQKLIQLIEQDKLLVAHTDLKKFDPNSIQDHYQLELKDYQVEISHSKQPDSGKDFYTLLFNNLKKIEEGCSQKIILAYLHLSEDQFNRFAKLADEQIAKKKREAEEKRFLEAMQPVDQALDNLLGPKPTKESDNNLLENNFELADVASEPEDSKEEVTKEEFEEDQPQLLSDKPDTFPKASEIVSTAISKDPTISSKEESSTPDLSTSTHPSSSLPSTSIT